MRLIFNPRNALEQKTSEIVFIFSYFAVSVPPLPQPQCKYKNDCGISLSLPAIAIHSQINRNNKIKTTNRGGSHFRIPTMNARFHFSNLNLNIVRCAGRSESHKDHNFQLFLPLVFRPLLCGLKRAYVRVDNGCIRRFLINICAHLRAYCNKLNIRRQHRRSGIGDCVQENYFNKALFRYFTFIEVFTSATIIASRIATMQNDDRFFVFVRWASWIVLQCNAKHSDIYYAWAWCMETGIAYTQRLNPMQRRRFERRTERKFND